MSTITGRWLRESSVGRHADGAEVGRVFEEEFLQFGQDVFAVRVLAQCGDVGSNLVHENLALLRLGHVDHFLHHVVGKLVLHHGLQRTVVAETRKFIKIILQMLLIKEKQKYFYHVRLA